MQRDEPGRQLGSTILSSTCGTAWGCSPASWVPCSPGNLGRVNPVSGDQSVKTSLKGSVWAQKLCFCMEPRAPGLGSAKLTERPFMSLSGHISEKEKESKAFQSRNFSSQQKPGFLKKKLINFCGFNKSKRFCGFPPNFSPFSIKTKASI